MNLLVLVFLVLLPLAAAQSSYPGCITPSCTPLRNTALSACGFDIAATVNATVGQTQCICTLDNIQSVIQPCLECLQLSPDASMAGYFGEICADAGVSTSTGTSRSTVTSSSTTSTTTTSTDTNSSTTTEHSSTSTSSSTSTKSQKQLAGIPTIAPTGAGAGRVAHVPVFGLAVVLAVVAQAAF